MIDRRKREEILGVVRPSKRAEKKFVEDREMIALETTNRFFDLYLAKLEIQIARDNQSYLDTLAIFAEGRFQMGRISETEMLQVQLSARNAEARVSELNQDLQTKTERLRDYLGIKENVIFEN